ncbi:MAG: alpha/beta hydrolase, partial [Chloroflexota bacterium]
MEPEVRYCTAADGVRIAYTVSGEGPPLLMAVDPLSSHVQLEWSHPTSGAVQREYARRNTLIRYDPRGSGLSDRIISTSIEESLMDIDAVVERAGFDQFALNSVLSATLPMIVYAARNPERITRFLIVDGILKMRDLLGTSQAQALIAAAKTDWFLATETIGYIAFGAGRDVNANHGAYIRACIGPESLDLTEWVLQTDVTEYARQVKAPTLVMKHTGIAIVTMEATKDLVATIPNAKLLMLEGTFVDNIEETAARALSFINDEAEAPASSPRASDLPSGTAIILFADIVDSTALTE